MRKSRRTNRHQAQILPSLERVYGTVSGVASPAPIDQSDSYKPLPRSLRSWVEAVGEQPSVAPTKPEEAKEDEVIDSSFLRARKKSLGNLSLEELNERKESLSNALRKAVDSVEVRGLELHIADIMQAVAVKCLHQKKEFLVVDAFMEAANLYGKYDCMRSRAYTLRQLGTFLIEQNNRDEAHRHLVETREILRRCLHAVEEDLQMERKLHFDSHIWKLNEEIEQVEGVLKSLSIPLPPDALEAVNSRENTAPVFRHNPYARNGELTHVPARMTPSSFQSSVSFFRPCVEQPPALPIALPSPNVELGFCPVFFNSTVQVYPQSFFFGEFDDDLRRVRSADPEEEKILKSLW